MTRSDLDLFLQKRRCTLLGVGPMSLNCVNTTIDLANEYQVPIFLIASRRQIDASVLGGGYVNRWNTRDFATHVRSRDRGSWISLCRDHGGPWQGDREEALSANQAMESAKTSFSEDITSGFQILHIDTSLSPGGSPDFETTCQRAFELYEYCWKESLQHQREILFEIGTEEQSGLPAASLEELRRLINAFQRFCHRGGFPEPTFLVVQTGTKVLETRNVGSFDSPFRIAHELPAEIQVPKILEICNDSKLYLKEHNGDYLSDEALRWHPKLGIHAMNVAPEFGVTESRALLQVLEENHLHKLSEAFIELAHGSGKWGKWVPPETKIDMRQKALIAGHYVFATDAFWEIKTRAQRALDPIGLDLDQILQKAVCASILRYLRLLRLVHP